MEPIDPNHLPDDDYVGKTDRKDPVLSPLFADLHGMPPSLLVTSTRDILLSDTTTLQRAMLRAGVDAQLVVFEALPHAFWYHFQLPETKEALAVDGQVFRRKGGAIKSCGSVKLATVQFEENCSYQGFALQAAEKLQMRAHTVEERPF